MRIHHTEGKVVKKYSDIKIFPTITMASVD